MGMIGRLKMLARKVGGRPVVVPTDDHYAQTLARFRSELEPEMMPCVAGSETVELLVHKGRFSEWARAKGVRAPRTAAASEPVDSLGLPLVAKPINKSNFRVVARQLPRGRMATDLRFTLIRNEIEWRAFREENAANLEHIVVQEFIEGTTADMYSIGVYADRQSRITGLFVGRKLRGYPAQYGNTKLGQNDCVPDQILAEVDKIVRDLRYTGIAEFEYRRVPTTGEFRLIEVNPRCWSWIGATAESPANIPWIAYRDMIGAPVEPAIDNRTPGVLKYVQIISDMSNVFVRYRWDHPAWVMGPRSWWRSLDATRLVIAEFNRGDWPIALYCLWMLAFNGLSFFSRRVSAD
jgi:predicted ATP-grasp superfamily ATP-dependent carboligase